MAPVIPILFILSLVILIAMGVLIYWGISGIQSSTPAKRFGGITAILIASALLVLLGFIAFILFHHDDHIRNGFVGNYKSVIDVNNKEDIELTIDVSTYSISENSYTECHTGTWSPALMDDGYIIEFKCSQGRSLGQFRLKEGELSDYRKLRFMKTTSGE